MWMAGCQLQISPVRPSIKFISVPVERAEGGLGSFRCDVVKGLKLFWCLFMCGCIEIKSKKCLLFESKGPWAEKPSTGTAGGRLEVVYSALINVRLKLFFCCARVCKKVCVCVCALATEITSHQCLPITCQCLCRFLSVKDAASRIPLCRKVTTSSLSVYSQPAYHLGTLLGIAKAWMIWPAGQREGERGRERWK